MLCKGINLNGFIPSLLFVMQAICILSNKIVSLRKL